MKKLKYIRQPIMPDNGVPRAEGSILATYLLHLRRTMDYDSRKV